MLKRIFAYSLLLLLSGHAVSQTSSDEQTYQRILNTCIEQQFTESDSPSLNKKLDLLEVCPDLSILLATRESKDYIQPPLESDTSLNRLLDEQRLRQTPYSTPNAPITDLERVSVLAKNYDFNSPAAEEPGWWQILKQWLKDKYGNQNEDSGIDWLLALLDGFSIPDWLYKTILYGSIALVILLAVVVIANELRHYKRFKHRDQQHNDVDKLNPLHHFRTLEWDEIQNLPLNQKTGALLQYLIQQCINRQWLPDNNSFTNREFYQSLKKLDSNKALSFNKVVNAAEKDIYGKQPLNAKELQQLFSVTEELLANNEALA